MVVIPSPLLALALLLSACVIGHDLYSRRVPNTLLVATLVLAMVWQALMLGGVVAATSPGIGQAFAAMLIGLVAMLPFYALKWMGAGDVKLIAVLGFLLGLKPLLIVWVLGNMLLGAHTLLLLAGRLIAGFQPRFALLQAGWESSPFRQRLRKPHQGRKGMPFAAYLGIGVFLYTLSRSWLEAFV